MPPFTYLTPSADGHWACCHLVTLVKVAAVSICVKIFVPVFSSLGHIPTSGITQSNSMFDFWGVSGSLGKALLSGTVPLWMRGAGRGRRG